jgi:RimJ/RimL family protein N-acetyltransferase/acyl carrier protein
MDKNKLIKILSSISPGNHGDELIFLNLNKSKKYFGQFSSYSKNDKFFEFFEFSAFKKKIQFNSYINKLYEAEKHNTKNSTYQKFWLIINKENNSLVGSAKLSSIDPVRKSVEWGFGINPEFWGSDYILKVQLSLINYVFKTLNLNRLFGHTHIKNNRVIKSVEALGFRKEGIKYDYYYHQKKKKFFDAYAYSYLKKDFKKKRKGILKKNILINFSKINEIISKALKKKLPLKKNIKMNEVSNWDSLKHFEIINLIEKKFKLKLNNQELLNCTNTENICKVLKNLTVKKKFI